ncbi:hypothetical protein B0A48_15445 [Cryoendolithus antarcticus]|uniref:Major facilitator superfamily (MFS) profile domain-containing protein n=1 Tax=Cryoendolithus antarcticus TaxID=1507870 RepID=A0A1V8SI09_9PEZI|nr:hypothetical protein B0A48_15445 [Cryoendolithus antarcticus]
MDRFDSEDQTAEVTGETRRHDPTLRGWRYYAVLFSLCFALFLGAIDSSVVATALVTIGAHFDDFVRLQWVVLAYLLVDLGFALIFARVSDVIGRKWASIWAVAILTVGSLGAGLSTSINQLVIFRAIQGLGAAGVYSLPLTVIPEITPAELFGFMSAVSGLVFTCSSILGPTIGGVITTQSSWRWCFLFNVPCGVFAIAVMLATWPKQDIAGRITWSQLDFIGALLIIGTTVLTVFALQEAGSDTYAWSSPTIIGCLVGGAVAAVVFGTWIWFLSKTPRKISPLFHTRVIKDRVLLGAFLVAMLSGYVLYVILIELSERLQIVNGRTAQGAGIDLLPFLGSAAVSSGIAGFLSSGAKNRSFETITVFSAFTALGCGLLAFVSKSATVPAALYGYQVILGFGIGGVLVSGTIVVKLSASQLDSASAQGVQAQTRILGGNLGLAIATIILNARLNVDLNGTLTPQQLSDLKRSLNSIGSLDPRQVQAVGLSFANAFRIQLVVCLGVAIVSLCCCAMIWQRNPRTFKDLKEAGG